MCPYSSKRKAKQATQMKKVKTQYMFKTQYMPKKRATKLKEIKNSLSKENNCNAPFLTK